MPNDPSDPTIKAFTDSCSAELTNLRFRRATLHALLNATVAGDLAAQSALQAGLAPLISKDAGPFYLSLNGQVNAANNNQHGKDVLAASIATEVAAIIDRAATLLDVRDSTVGNVNGRVPDVAASNAALAKLNVNSRADANPFYVQLPTLQANAAAIVAQPVAGGGA